MFHYLGWPLLDSFYGLKYLISQYIVSRYHKGKLWFGVPNEINDGLIDVITILPNEGPPVLVSLKLNLVEYFTESPKGKNS